MLSIALFFLFITSFDKHMIPGNIFLIHMGKYFHHTSNHSTTPKLNLTIKDNQGN